MSNHFYDACDSSVYENVIKAQKKEFCPDTAFLSSWLYMKQNTFRTSVCMWRNPELPDLRNKNGRFKTHIF